MKRTFKTLLIPAALAGMLALPTLAQAKAINHRQTHQAKRIQSGVNNGSLSPQEAARLRAREAGIRRQEARDRQSGGKFTKRERRTIQHRLNNTNNAIYHQKHDSQTRQHPNRGLHRGWYKQNSNRRKHHR